MEAVFKVLILGVFATAIIDVWATFSNRVLKFPRTNWAMVGRWLGHIQYGKLTHNPISSSSSIKYENTVGWIFHYLIGVFYAFFYIAFVVLVLDKEPTLLSGWIFGLITILSPWFILQPSLGFGICGSQAPQPNMVRLQHFAIHSIFGIALYYGWLWGNNA